MRWRVPTHSTVHTVTDARRPMSADIRYRERRYLISMGIRTLCLILAVVVPITWFRFVAIAAAIALPYFAVVFANGGREPESSARFETYDPQARESDQLGEGRREIDS